MAKCFHCFTLMFAYYDILSFRTNFEKKLVFFEDANTFTCREKYIYVAPTFVLSVFSKNCKS